MRILGTSQHRYTSITSISRFSFLLHTLRVNFFTHLFLPFFFIFFGFFFVYFHLVLPITYFSMSLIVSCLPFFGFIHDVVFRFFFFFFKFSVCWLWTKLWQICCSFSFRIFFFLVFFFTIFVVVFSKYIPNFISYIFQCCPLFTILFFCLFVCLFVCLKRVIFCDLFL